MKFEFDSTNPIARNEQVVRTLNEILRGPTVSPKERPYYLRVSRLRTAVLNLQRTPYADTGLPFLAAVQLLESTERT